MNRMELEARSETCVNYHDGDITVSMKNAASLGKFNLSCFFFLPIHASNYLPAAE
jgi:hypothetical protein